jgi:hypothetical protein
VTASHGVADPVATAVPDKEAVREGERVKPAVGVEVPEADTEGVAEPVVTVERVDVGVEVRHSAAEGDAVVEALALSVR